ncbi:MAG: hypothetical protein LBD48_04785 [Treponema sp.]|jgi:hypothetical protein|nr:hypothetical protein [Treponema sp.]
MSDTGEQTGRPEESPRKRPNAKYRLSKETINEDAITFYYNREERLSKAPQTVRDLYREEPPKRFNLLRPLTGSKPRMMMFGSIVLICAAIMVLSVFGYTGSSWDFDGNQLTIQALKYEDTVIVALKKNIKKSLFGFTASAYTGAVNIAVMPAGMDSGTEQPGGIFYHRVFFTLEEREDYRFAVPFDDDELVLVLQTERKTLSVKIKPE